MYLYIYIHIYIDRERDIYIYIYIYCFISHVSQDEDSRVAFARPPSMTVFRRRCRSAMFAQSACWLAGWVVAAVAVAAGLDPFNIVMHNPIVKMTSHTRGEYK